MVHPHAGIHYPRSVGEFQAWCRTDADGLDYLEWLRWPAGLVCAICSHAGGWRLSDGRFLCGGCGGRTSVTAGTIFQRTRTPLTVWFTAGRRLVSGKDGISALSLKRTLAIGSYPTAWAMRPRRRSVLGRPGRDRLSGRVAVDQTSIGGQEGEWSGGRAPGQQVVTGLAVEVLPPRGFGRCRRRPLTEASSASRPPFVTDVVAPGSTVITDGWPGYGGLDQLGSLHPPRRQRAARAGGEEPSVLLPGVHRVASLAKRGLLGTHQGAVDRAHRVSDLNEFLL